MVNTDLVWLSIRNKIEAERSPQAAEVIRTYLVRLPITLGYINDLVTLDLLWRLKLRVDESLLQSQFPYELAVAEFNYPSKRIPEATRSIARNKDAIESQLRRWIELGNSNIRNMNNWVADDRFDKKRRLPHWSREQQVLYKAGLPIQLVELYPQYELTFKAIWETDANVMFPYLPLGRW